MKSLFMLISLLLPCQLYAKVQWQADPGSVALTFDDGPSLIYTPKVLAILKKNHIKATFFVMGAQAKKHPELIKKIAREGHAVAIHTMTHTKLTRLSNKQLHYEVVRAKNIVHDILGKAPVCLRPPYGMTNERVKKFIRNQGMVPVPMGFNSFDYENRGTDRLVNWVVRNAQSKRVFLLHDGYNHRQQTVAALPQIIAGIRAKGLSFSAICYP